MVQVGGYLEDVYHHRISLFSWIILARTPFETYLIKHSRVYREDLGKPDS
jgi:hypothetical protein